MRAVIVGAGIAGLALAQRLGTLGGWEVEVLEKAPGPRPQGYMIDFFAPGHDAAEAMGVLPRLRELGYRVDEAAFVDGHGRRRAAIPYARLERVVGGKLLSIMRPDLERGLREHLPPEVALRYGTSVTAVEDRPGGGVRLTLTDGTTREADLLVGADGIHSAVRSLVFGEESRFVRPLGFHTAAFVFESPEVFEAVGGRFCMTDSAGCEMGFYTLRDGRVAAFAVHRTAETALPEDPRAEVRRAYAGLGWVAPHALEACPPPEEVYYDLVAQTTVPAWSRGRTVLLGDAAYAVSLLAGQGASLGVAGAYVLAEELAGGDVDGALARYERRWRPVTDGKQEVARKGARWFLPATPGRLRARRAALRLARVLPGADRMMAAAVVGKPATLHQNGHARAHESRTGIRTARR
ncbi:FAD-dependent monooxygenase [Streptomyces albiaxialis]|uniref:FAD-dependent monooxygenase n=1 Tax=Streptomyces albiaxialis TaxID=329523 RepID=A0ABP5H2F5_9ACTN